MTSRRRAVLSLLVLFIAVCISVLWFGCGADRESQSGNSDLGATARAPAPARLGQSLVPSAAVNGDEHEGRAIDDFARRPWWIKLELMRVRPGNSVVRVDALWWPKRPPAGHADPVRRVRGQDVRVGETPLPYRLEGQHAGYILCVLVEDGRERPLEPWLSEPVREVLPGRGYGIGTIFVGTWSLAAEARDADNFPVAGLRVVAYETTSDRSQAAVTDEAGQIEIAGLASPTLRVTWQASRAHGPGRRASAAAPVYADERALDVRADRGLVTLRVRRNPRVTLRGFDASLGQEFTCAVGVVTVTGIPPDTGYYTLHQSTQPFHVGPGRWRLGVEAPFHSRITLETEELALDEETTIDVHLSFDEDVPLLGVKLIAPWNPHDARRAEVAAELRALAGSGNGRLRSQTVGEGVLLPMSGDGEYELAAAMRDGDRVALSLPEQIVLRDGERKRVVINLHEAGAVDLEQLATGPRVGVAGYAFPGRACVADGPLRFINLPSTDARSRWWFLPGTYHFEVGPNERALSPGPAFVIRAGAVASWIAANGELREAAASASGATNATDE